MMMRRLLVIGAVALLLVGLWRVSQSEAWQQRVDAGKQAAWEGRWARGRRSE